MVLDRVSLVQQLVARYQWSFRKTGTVGTPPSQAEISVWVQALGRLHPCARPLALLEVGARGGRQKI